MKKRIILSLIITGGFCLGVFLTQSSGQVPVEREFTDFFDSQKRNEPISNSIEKESPGTLNFYIKSESQADTVDFEESKIRIFF